MILHFETLQYFFIPKTLQHLFAVKFIETHRHSRINLRVEGNFPQDKKNQNFSGSDNELFGSLLGRSRSLRKSK